MGPVPPIGVERRVKAGSPIACGASCTPVREGVAGSQSVGGGEASSKVLLNCLENSQQRSQISKVAVTC